MKIKFGAKVDGELCQTFLHPDFYQILPERRRIGNDSKPSIQACIKHFFPTSLLYLLSSAAGRGRTDGNPALCEVLKFLAGFISYGVIEKPSPAQLWPESGPYTRAELIKDCEKEYLAVQNRKCFMELWKDS